MDPRNPDCMYQFIPVGDLIYIHVTYTVHTRVCKSEDAVALAQSASRDPNMHRSILCLSDCPDIRFYDRSVMVTLMLCPQLTRTLLLAEHSFTQSVMWVEP